MRSIGKRNIALVKRVTLDILKDKRNAICDSASYTDVEDKVAGRLPIALWGTWEMADQEIRRIINDTIMKGE